MTFVVFIDGQL